jgi:hypothetical protein
VDIMGEKQSKIRSCPRHREHRLQKFNMTQSQPDFTGVWELNIAKSTMYGPVPAQTLIKIEHAEPLLVQTILVTDGDGRESVLIFHYEAGKETTNHAGPGTVRSRASWVGRELVIESWMNAKDRELRFKDHWSLSDDDDTLTMAHRDDDLLDRFRCSTGLLHRLRRSLRAGNSRRLLPL